MSHKIPRHEIFSSPELSSIKHQRIHTDQKAPNMHKKSLMKPSSSTSNNTYSSQSTSSSPKIHQIFTSIMLYLGHKPSSNHHTSSNIDIRLQFSLCPLSDNSYDLSLFQILQIVSPKDWSTWSSHHVQNHQLLFYNTAWSICCHPSNTIQENLNKLFHQFLTHHSLDSVNLNENQILTNLGQLELATFLLFLSWNIHHVLNYLHERNVLETIINGLVSSLHATAKKPHRVGD